MGEWGKAWQRAREGSVRASTFARDETYWRLHIAPTWAAVKLVDIDHSDVQDWADGLTDDLAPAPVGKAVGIFASSSTEQFGQACCMSIVLEESGNHRSRRGSSWCPAPKPSPSSLRRSGLSTGQWC